jgi:glycosyltransferase involved in cell wall biosynthesis
MGGRDIFFVANEVNELGGVARWQNQLARLLAARGHRVRVIGIAPPEVPMELGPGGAAPPFETATLYARRPPARRPAHSLAGLRRERERRAVMREAAARLTGILRSARPGGVVVVTQVWAMEWVALADTTGLPVIGMSHESYDYSRQSSRFQRVLTHYAGVDRLLLLTQEDADRWIGAGLDNVGFMPNPLPALPAEPSPRTEKTVACVGRLSHQKGVDMLLDAWAETAPRQPGWRLRIHGAGELEEPLKRQCRELGLDGSVEWAGQTADVTGALRQASVFVQSSRGEGFPLAILEAMACGLPCAAFDCAPGVREIIRDGEDGLLARPGNTSELARALVRLMADAGLRDTMGERARENVRRFAPEAVADRWEALFAFLER